MPSWAPRSDTSKKREQLLQRQQELLHAVRSAQPTPKVARAAERVRAAQLSLLKARMHWALESRFRWTAPPSPRTRDFGEVAEIEEATQAWAEKPVEAIIAEVAA